MPTNFFTLPGELRNKIYKYCLVRDKNINLWRLYSYRDISAGLLRVNRKIHHEAVSILYGCNCFNLIDESPELITLFLDEIGPTNANHLECVRIEFPHLQDHYDEVCLKGNSLRILATIQDHCTSLKTLRMSSYYMGVMGLSPSARQSPEFLAKAMALVDAHLRKIPSLQEINFEASWDGECTDIERAMGNLGWTINVELRVDEDEDEDDDDLWEYEEDVGSSDGD